MIEYIDSSLRLNQFNLIVGKNGTGETHFLNNLYNKIDKPSVFLREGFNIVDNCFYNVEFDNDDLNLINNTLKLFGNFDLISFSCGSEPVIILNSKSLQLNECGSGLRQYVYLLLGLYHSRNSVLLLDGFDFSISSLILQDVYGTLFKLAIKYNVQMLFVVNTSEVIDKVLITEYIDKINVIRFRYGTVTSFTGEFARRVIDNMNVDLRV